MADTIEEKWPKGVAASIAFLFIIIIGLGTLAPNSLIDKVMLKEREWANALLTKGDMDIIVGRTSAIYTSVVIDSGAKEIVSELFMPRGNGTVDAFERSVGWWFVYLEERGVALQKILYQMTYRIVLAAFWLPLLIVVLIPSIYAGYMRWQAKRHGFDYASPFLNNNAANFLCWGVVLLLLSVLVPLPLPPLVVCTFVLVLLPIVMSLLISNLPKRI